MLVMGSIFKGKKKREYQKKIIVELGELPDLQFMTSNLFLVLIPPVTWRSHLQESADPFLNNSVKTKPAFLFLLILAFTMNEI